MIRAGLARVGRCLTAPRFLFWAQYGAQALGIGYLALGLVVMTANRPLDELIMGVRMGAAETVGPWTGWEWNAAVCLILGLSGVVSSTFFALYRETLRAAPFGRIAFANTDLAGAMDHRYSILEAQRAVGQLLDQVLEA